MVGPYFRSMNFHGISFNEDWVKSQEEYEFVYNSLNDNHWKDPANRCDDDTRITRLSQLWRLLNPEKVANANDQQPSAGFGINGPAFPGGEQKTFVSSTIGSNGNAQQYIKEDSD